MKPSVRYLIPRTAAEDLQTSLQVSGSNPRLDIKNARPRVSDVRTNI